MKQLLFIILITVVGLWVGGIYLFLFLNMLRDDVKEINEDVETLISRINTVEKRQTEKSKIEGEEFLGI
jgi:biopolymer transport protein ExbB/TolQ